MKKQEALQYFEYFLNSVNSPMIYLKQIDVNDSDRDNRLVLKFEATLRPDKYIIENSPPLNLSKEFYTNVKKSGKLFMKQEPDFNNTGHIGWFIIPIESEV